MDKWVRDKKNIKTELLGMGCKSMISFPNNLMFEMHWAAGYEPGI